MGDGPSVVVVGSGAAGLAAALGAAGAGADVLVLERAPTVGGTTAMSGGVVWMPAHGRSPAPSAAAGGGADSAERALAYLCAACRGEVDVGLMRAFVNDAGRVASEIEQRTPLRWEVLDRWPDYRGELPGAAAGRSLWPRPLRLPAGVDARVHAAVDQPSPAPVTGGASAPADDSVVLRGHVRGRALCAALLAGVLDAGVDVRTGARATALARRGDAVRGVLVDGELLPGRVVLATGGFQHDPVLTRRFLPGPPVAPMGAVSCAGDGLHMAMTVDAELANMAEGWWMPAIHVPGEEIDGAAHYRPLHGERAKPGAIMVDGHGRRFVDEAQNYGDVGRAMRHGDAGRADRRCGALHPSLSSGRTPGPWWLVFDAAYRRRYPVGPLEPGGFDPPWLLRAVDIAHLAQHMGVPEGALVSSVRAFNAGAAAGRDDVFGRGSFSYDRWIGDPGAPHPTLAPVAEGPFYAVRAHLGCMGTKGGPRTDDRGRVLGVTGPVAGLFAAGNAAANPFGGATPAGGSTLGPALVFGFRAGETAGRP